MQSFCLNAFIKINVRLVSPDLYMLILLNASGVIVELFGVVWSRTTLSGGQVDPLVSGLITH
jgi:hypothetical protein